MSIVPEALFLDDDTYMSQMGSSVINRNIINVCNYKLQKKIGKQNN